MWGATTQPSPSLQGLRFWQSLASAVAVASDFNFPSVRSTMAEQSTVCFEPVRHYLLRSQLTLN